MFPLSSATARQYLIAAGWPGAAEASITALGGGVSNNVLLIEGSGGRIVCKQALEKLRVEADWRSQPERTLREAEAMQSLSPLLPPGAVPRIVFLDRENCIFAMEAAPAGAADWKTVLLSGAVDPAIAAAAARVLGGIIRASLHNAEWQARFGDQTVFDELRLDPYYRFTAERHPEYAAHFHALIDMCRTRRVALVHGDWSPKNLLVASGAVTAIDFEVVHYGDPAFDTAFLLCHLLLKSIHRPGLAPQLLACANTFWETLDLAAALPWLKAGTVAHLGGLLLARADGKSPAEYLTPEDVLTLRRLARRVIENPPDSIDSIWQCL